MAESNRKAGRPKKTETTERVNNIVNKQPNEKESLLKTVAQSIVSYRDAHGAFHDRQALMSVPRLGPKTFEQAAGFLRITNGSNPLDASAVHPEAYPVVQKIVQVTGKSIKELMGNHDVLAKLVPSDFADERFGLPTVKDILVELEKPGRDPRPEFKTATWRLLGRLLI